MKKSVFFTIILILISLLILLITNNWTQENTIKKYRSISQSIEEFEQKMNAAGFIRENLPIGESLNTIDGNRKFKLLKFKRNNTYYVHLEFFAEKDKSEETLTITIDNTEISKPLLVYSENLKLAQNSPAKKTSTFKLINSQTNNKYWVGFYFKGKNPYTETVHGELMFTIDNNHWRGSY